MRRGCSGDEVRLRPVRLMNRPSVGWLTARLIGVDQSWRPVSARAPIWSICRPNCLHSIRLHVWLKLDQPLDRSGAWNQTLITLLAGPSSLRRKGCVMLAAAAANKRRAPPPRKHTTHSVRLLSAGAWAAGRTAAWLALRIIVFSRWRVSVFVSAVRLLWYTRASGDQGDALIWI
jgi:hypothetical protein